MRNRSTLNALNRLLRLSTRDLATGIGDVKRAKRLADWRDQMTSASRIGHGRALLQHVRRRTAKRCAIAGARRIRYTSGETSVKDIWLAEIKFALGILAIFGMILALCFWATGCSDVSYSVHLAQHEDPRFNWSQDRSLLK